MSTTSSRPRFVLTPDIDAPAAPKSQYVIRRNCVDAILHSGCLPLVLPCADDAAACLDAIDGLAVTGGLFDIEPDGNRNITGFPDGPDHLILPG